MYRLTTRSGSSVERERHDSLDEALHALERQGREIERTADAKPVGGALMRRIEPARQVLARLELLLREAVWRKELKHHVGEPGFRQPPRTMSAIGG